MLSCTDIYIYKCISPTDAISMSMHTGIGMLICSPQSLTDQHIKVENKLGLICGTSTCHMIVSEKPAYIPGVWGPYYSAMVPGGLTLGKCLVYDCSLYKVYVISTA